MTSLVRTSVPPIESAKLPVVYKDAVSALAKCERVDECKAWKDKAAAIASYARQAQDEDLLHAATRIRARATRRLGQLLSDIPAPEGRPPKRENQAGTGPVLVTRSEVADRVGLSDRQVKDSLRIAAIPESKFERAVEAEEPATITELAQMGTKPKPFKVDIGDRAPDDYRVAMYAHGMVGDFVNEANSHDMNAIMRGTDADECAENAATVRKAIAWLERLLARLEKKK